jgi:hypothetical protein
MSEVTKQDLVEMEHRLLDAILGEMGTRFGEVNGRLDRMDATLQMHGKMIASGTKAIAGFTEWTSRADADYAKVLEQLADLQGRMAKLERPS